jgi:hypothetical protein
MMMMVLCNDMSMPVDDNASSGATRAASVISVSHSHMQIVRCNAIAWTDKTEEEGRLKVLVTRSDPVTGAVVTKVELSMLQMALMGTQAKRRYMDCKWWQRLWQAMLKRKSSATAQAVERAAKHQWYRAHAKRPLVLFNKIILKRLNIINIIILNYKTL